MNTLPGSTGPEPVAQKAVILPFFRSCPGPVSGENYSLFRLKRGVLLISIRALEIGALQEAVIDENL